MINALLRRTLIGTLTVAVLTLLSGCSREQGTGQPRVAMHVDAVLEFAMEYPAAWQKQALVDRRSGTGKVTWSAPPADPSLGRPIELSVTSRRRSIAAPPADALLDELRRQIPGFELNDRQAVDLPAGVAWRLLGFTPGRNYAAYLLLTDRREYLALFAADTADFAASRRQLDEIMESFAILDGHGTPQPD